MNTFVQDRVESASCNIEKARERIGIGEILVVGLSLCAICVLLCLCLGRDLNWDYFNYHDYAALLSVNDRLGRDFFPAGYQGYLNPLPFFPFQLMLSHGWHSAIIAAVIASVQSLNLLFLYLICREITVDMARMKRPSAIVLTVFGAATPVFAMQLGSTFIDCSITPLVLAAVWLLLRSDSMHVDFLVGLLCGVAAGLKLTNVAYALAIAVAVLVPAKQNAPLCWRTPLRTCFGIVVGFLIAYGMWGWKLWRLFGSPVFPLFNDIFQAPDFPKEPLSFHRFVPQSAIDWLLRPFQMAKFEGWVYVETIAPDIRPAVLVALIACVCLAAMLSAMRVFAPRTLPSGVKHFPEKRLWAFFLVSFVGWFFTSANGRYGLPVLLLLGPCVFVVLRKLVLPRRALQVCVALCAIQIVYAAGAGNPHWNPTKWTKEWLPATVPSEMQQTPYLYLSIGASSESYLVRHLHPASAFINPIGLLSFRNDGPEWTRFQKLLKEFNGKTKYIFLGAEPPSGKRLTDLIHRRYSDRVSRLGLGIVEGSCQTLHFNSDPGDDTYFNSMLPDPVDRVLVVCDAELVAETPGTALERLQVEKIFDALEDKCPNIFTPRRSQLEKGPAGWSRRYPKFDLFVGLGAKDKVVFYYMEHQATDSVIGAVDSWEKDMDNFVCELPHRGQRGEATLKPYEAN